ncbi:MAG: permease [Candidatus Omnitrophica bacterium]|nr:permease [Candidatus Omnitrophota bacterium]
MIKPLIDWFVYYYLKMPKGALFSEAIDFFLYDTIKIFLLLAVIIFFVSFIRTFFPPEKTRAILSHKRTYVGNILASLLGIVTPFCSCSAVPLFLGFVEAGVSLGVTFSFLVASPMINEVALVMLWGLFGWKIAFIYIGSGLMIAIVSGLLIGYLKLENLVVKISHQKTGCCYTGEGAKLSERLIFSREYTKDIIKHIWLFVVMGIGLGAWIHGFVPQDFLARYAGPDKWFAVPLATLIGIPLYSNAAGVIPLVSALTEKGVAMGTALAFMMAVTALSLPEFLILKRVMKLKLLLIFASVVGAGIIFTGYLFNLIIK